MSEVDFKLANFKPPDFVIAVIMFCQNALELFFITAVSTSD